MAAKYVKSGYSPLRGEDELLFQSDDNRVAIDAGQGTVASRKLLISVTVNIVLSLLLIGVGVARVYNNRQLNGNLRKCSSYSPIRNLLDLQPRIKKINGTLFHNKSPSIARQMPNPTSDSVWEEWELTRVIPITKDQVIKMGKDPKYTVRLENKLWGLGNDAYAGVLDVYHQLHCLNSLRQIAYGTYYNASAINPKAERLPEIHVNHCVDILMQALQCSGNVNILTLDWVETQMYPFPDMSANRQCINFERLTEWRRENSIDIDKYVEVMRKPQGVRQRPMADQFYAYHDQHSPNHLNGANTDEDFNI